MDSNRADEQKFIILKNGMKLCYAVYGDSNSARKSIYFHGFPGSRLEAFCADRAARERGVCIIAVDRPGVGRSSYSKNHNAFTFASVLDDMLTELKIGTVSLLAVSGGTPFALAFAALYPQKVERVVVAGGMGEITDEGLKGQVFFNRALLTLGRRNPWLGKCLISLISRLWKREPRIAALWLKSALGEEDRKILRNKALALPFFRSLKESLSNAPGGLPLEFATLMSAWTFPLENITASVIALHGEMDRYVPPDFLRESLKRIPGSQFEIVEGGGHFFPLLDPSLLINRLD